MLPIPFLALILAVPAAAAPPDRFEDVLALRTVEALQASPDGRWLAFLVREADVAGNRYVTNLWSVPTDGSAPARALTHGGGASAPLRFAADSGRVAFLYAPGETAAQVFAVAPAGGEPRALVALPQAVSGFVWGQDGRLLLIAPEPESAEEQRRRLEKDDAQVLGRQFRNARLWMVEPGGTPQAVGDGGEHVREAAWSPDGRRVAFVATPTPEADSTQDAVLRLLDLASGRSRPVPGSRLATSPTWSPDGARVAFVAPRDGHEISREDLWVWSPGDDTARGLSSGLDRDIEAFYWTEDGRGLEAVFWRGGRSEGSRLDLDGRADALALPAATVSRFQPCGSGRAYVRTDGPDEVWLGERKLTVLNAAPAPRREAVRYRGPAGEIEGVITRPATPPPWPLIVRPHGGPRGHTTLAYDDQSAVLAASGFLVLQPNFRGSTGYGDAFTRANVADWTTGPLADVMAGVDHLVATGEADPQRLYLYGWSYGGILANWAATREPRFRAIVSGAGVADFRLQYALSDARRWRFDYFGGSPFRGHAPLYARESPISLGAQAGVPTLFLHGEADRRCPLAQGLLMHRALLDHGVETELVVYPREGHGFTEPRHVVDRLRRVVDWFRRHERRTIALTFDDLPLGGPAADLALAGDVTRRLLATLRARRVPAIGFVNESKLAVPGEEAERTALLGSWLQAGMPLGNHTYSHRSLNRTPLKDFEKDVLRGEVVTRRLMKERGQRLRYFRHPFTHTGATALDKKGFEDFLRAHSYEIAPFTVENADYIFNVGYRGDEEARVRTAYFDYTEAVLAFIEDLSRDTFGHEIPQILLVHANRLNADCLEEMLVRLQRRGYRFVTLEEALRDEAYRTPDAYVGPVGPSWLHRWRVAKALPSRLREEPDPPEFVLQLYRSR